MIANAIEMSVSEFCELLTKMDIDDTIEFATEKESENEYCGWFFVKNLYFEGYDTHILLFNFCGGEVPYAIPFEKDASAIQPFVEVYCRQQNIKHFYVQFPAEYYAVGIGFDKYGVPRDFRSPAWTTTKYTQAIDKFDELKQDCEDNLTDCFDLGKEKVTTWTYQLLCIHDNVTTIMSTFSVKRNNKETVDN